MPEADVPDSAPRPFHTLKQAAGELGMSYKRVRALAERGYFGDLVRSGEAGRGPYLVPDSTLRRLRNGERVAS